MSLKSLNLKYSYDSDIDDVLNEFYIPVLSQSVIYKRLAGFFSSTVLAIVAKGLAGFIRNGGKMELICSAKLSKQDIEIIEKAKLKPETIIENKFIHDLDNLENKFIEDHVRALGWMLVNNKLEIKIAIVRDENGFLVNDEIIEEKGIFHQKVGIFKDFEDNIISFSGSANESASGFIRNIEEFKVFRSWIDSEKEYLESDEKRFDKFWNSKGKKTEVIEITRAIKEKLIKIAPERIDEIDIDKWLNQKNRIVGKNIRLYDHQNEAIKNWLSNGNKGILEMATGTGKTFTALGCLKKISDTHTQLIAVITCPYDHLAKQWKDDIDDFGLQIDTIIADSTNSKWKNELTDYIYDVKIALREKLIILTTHTTFSSPTFIEIIKMVDKSLFLIADEVHGLGAPKRQKGLIENYEFRLGLSATPTRWFDVEGTEKIYDYFGKTVFEFSLKDAITTINPDTGLTYLTPYEYKPYFVELTADELDEYKTISKKIINVYLNEKNEMKKESLLKLLSMKRQNIIKNASNKYNSLKKILNDIDEIKHLLIYCLPEQIEPIQEMLSQNRIIHHKFTLHEGTKPEKKYGGISERKFLLTKFADGSYDALVAIKCLDEGVDVPPARIAIILASSGNPREYIQRAGRILRRHPEKEKSIIYDVVVIPPIYVLERDDFIEFETKIIEKELKRYKEFAYNAMNKIECLNLIESIEIRYKLFICVGE